MKFKFQFENVLKHRKTLEDIAQRDFESVQHEYLIEVQKLQQLRDDVTVAHQEAYKKQTDGGMQAGPALRQIHEFLKLQDLRIASQQKKVQEFENRVEEFREILRLKAIDYKMIESLKERRKQEHRKEKNKSEQKRADNLTAMRHLGNLARLREK